MSVEMLQREIADLPHFETFEVPRVANKRMIKEEEAKRSGGMHDSNTKIT